MIFKYCAECGHKLEDIKCGDDDCKICPLCKKLYGNGPLPVVEVLVVNEFNEILLLKQNYISKTKWTVVSGYMTNGKRYLWSKLHIYSYTKNIIGYSKK